MLNEDAARSNDHEDISWIVAAVSLFVKNCMRLPIIELNKSGRIIHMAMIPTTETPAIDAR